MVVVYASRRAGWCYGAAGDAGLVNLIHIVPMPAPGDQEILPQVVPLHAERTKVHGVRESV